MKKNKFPAFLILLILFTNSVFAADQAVQEAQVVDTSTIYEMPEFSSRTEIELYRPVQLPIQQFSIPRPLKIINLNEGFSLIFEKDTKVTNKDGALLAPVLKPPRKTLTIVANIPKPEEFMFEPFVIRIGNPCNESVLDGPLPCENPNEYFSPAASLHIELPESIEVGSYNILFFDTLKWSWVKARFIYDSETNMNKVDIPKSGFIAFVDKGGKKAVNISKIRNGIITATIPDNVQNHKFSLKAYEISTDTWKNRSYTNLTEDKIEFSLPASGVIAFVIKEQTQADIIKKQTQKNEKLFKDFNWEEWYANDLADLVERGLFEKNSEKDFRPNDNVNRAEAAKILSGAFNLPFARDTKLNDITYDLWFAQNAATTIEYGIFSPYLGNNFEPDAKVSKAEALAAILRAARIKLSDKDILGVDELIDVNTDNSYAKEIGFAVFRKMVAENSETFSPNQLVTRAQFAKMVNRTLRYIENAEMTSLNVEFGSKLKELVVFRPDELRPFKQNFENWEQNEIELVRLKKLLFHMGYFNGSFTDDFDSALEKALTDYQLSAGIYENKQMLGVGRFGNKTRNSINRIYYTIISDHLLVKSFYEK